jgi:hypothetical protein
MVAGTIIQESSDVKLAFIQSALVMVSVSLASAIFALIFMPEQKGCKSLELLLL